MLVEDGKDDDEAEEDDPDESSEEPEPMEIEKRPECIICMEAEVDAVLAPCFHGKYCHACASSILTCAVCRAPVQAVHRLYL